MNRTEHLLSCLAEECAEVAQRVSKAVELAEHWEGQCNRYVNGQCSTLRCLVRGGYKINSGPCDNSIATCEEHETATRLRELLSHPKPDFRDS